jgi:hypothetical protein
MLGRLAVSGEIGSRRVCALRRASRRRQPLAPQEFHNPHGGGIVGFRSAKARAFAEQKPTLAALCLVSHYQVFKDQSLRAASTGRNGRGPSDPGLFCKRYATIVQIRPTRSKQQPTKLGRACRRDLGESRNSRMKNPGETNLAGKVLRHGINPNSCGYAAPTTSDPSWRALHRCGSRSDGASTGQCRS